MVTLSEGDIVAVNINGRSHRTGRVAGIRDSDGKVLVLIDDKLQVSRHPRFVEVPVLAGKPLRLGDRLDWHDGAGTFERVFVSELRFNDDQEWWVFTTTHRGTSEGGAWNTLDRIAEACARA